MRARYLLPCIPVILAGQAFAEEAQMLPEMIVTANRVPTPTDHVGAAISTIGREELERRQIRRVEDALRELPGVNVHRAGSTGTPAQVHIRGLGPRNTLVLLDGIEINDPSRAQVQYEFGAIPIEDVERIDVLRGPQSSLYGSDATGGVINIITRRPTGPLQGSLSAEGGSYGTARAAAAVRGKSKQVEYGASLAGFNTRGFSAFNARRGGVEADPHYYASGSANLGLQMAENWRVDLLGRTSHAYLATDFNNADIVDEYYEKKETFGRIATTLDTFDARWRHVLGTSRSKHEREFKGRNSFSNGDSYDGYKDKIDYLSSFEIDASSSLVAGVENERERLDQRAIAGAGGSAAGVIDKSNDTQSYFLSYALSPLAALHLNSSLRHDEHQKFGGATTWRQTAAYRLEETGTKLRASYGTGFVAPSLYELSDPCIGRPNLQPERSRGWDIGFDQEFGAGRASLSATYFETHVKNQIKFATTGIACGIFNGNYQNIDRTLSRGIELGGSLRLNDGISLSASYTYVHAKDVGIGQDLFDIPRHQAYAAIDWRFIPEASLGLGFTYRDNSPVQFTNPLQQNSEYYLLELRAAWDVTANAELYGRLENLLNARYEAVWGYGTPSRSAYVGTRLKF